MYSATETLIMQYRFTRRAEVAIMPNADSANGPVLWAPQDMLISLRADCWNHVWLDCVALAGMLAPLFYLFFIDRVKASQ